MKVKGTYEGKECVKCGSRTRYVSSKRCVACKHNLSVKEWQRVKGKQAIAERHGLELI